MSFDARPGDRDRSTTARASSPSSRSLPTRHACVSCWKRVRLELAAARQARLDATREREIHVVAAEQQMIADGDALVAPPPIRVAALAATAMSEKSVVPPPMSHTSTTSPAASAAAATVGA